MLQGGVASVLNKLAKMAAWDRNSRSHTVAEQVNGACEMPRLDPLYVANEGVFIAVVDLQLPMFGGLLRNDENGSNAA